MLLHGHLFSDSKGTMVQLSWLRLLQDLAQTRQYNWGAGMLAFLYRQLDVRFRGQELLSRRDILATGVFF